MAKLMWFSIHSVVFPEFSQAIVQKTEMKILFFCFLVTFYPIVPAANENNTIVKAAENENWCDLIQPCDPRVTCHNLRPGFICDPCPPGFTGGLRNKAEGDDDSVVRRQICVDIDECAGGRVCDPNAHCTNTEGSYDCGPCREGFVGNEYIGCHSSEGNCLSKDICHEKANCISLGWGKHSCKCQLGWAGNGIHCSRDTDLDGWPDEKLPCSDRFCQEDNCPSIPNSGQEDTDGDGLGDACESDPIGDMNVDLRDVDGDGIRDSLDSDKDNDGISNVEDNCVEVHNVDQRDSDKDGIGDLCDNCPHAHNPGQEDKDNNNVGDACDSLLDTDEDGVSDPHDNCKRIPNSNQLDTDQDGIGDVCDGDIDNDGILNINDNCIFVENPFQLDANKNGIGDKCEDDNDGDGVDNIHDVCPDNYLISHTNFSNYQMIVTHHRGDPQSNKRWKVYNHGAEIVQNVNSDSGFAVGRDRFNEVDFEGTFFVETEMFDSFGLVFGYQSSNNYYTVIWKKSFEPIPEVASLQNNTEGESLRTYADPGIQIKALYTEPRPISRELSSTADTSIHLKLLWKDARYVTWKPKTSYRWHLIHRPSIGLMRLEIFEGERLVTDSGMIFDHTHKGGRLGVFSFSSEKIIWSNLMYRCNDTVGDELWTKRKVSTV